MPTETVYKLVLGYPSGRLISIWQIHGWSIDYLPEKKIKPPHHNSQILAFATLESADAFRREFGLQGTQLWECQANGVRKLDRVSGSSDPKAYHAFWAGNGGMAMSAFPGTVGCNSIRLIRPIEESELPKTA